MAQHPSRREVLKYLALCAAPALLGTVGCERHRYIRPAGELDLGTVRALLYGVVHVRQQSALVFRDLDGWRTLSARCSYNGCDTTYQASPFNTQDQVLLCPCCRSLFDMRGRPLPGSVAKHDLPWMKMEYRAGHLFGDPGQIVPASYRFTTPEIEDAIRKLRERIKQQGIGDEVKIPEVLLGQSDGEPGGMFLEDDPNLIHELDTIK